MTHFHNLWRFPALICLGILFAQCSKDDDNRIPVFPEYQLSLIHGESEKSWRLTEIVNAHADPGDDLYFDLDCVSDDIFTFSAADKKMSVTYGDELCFEDEGEGIFQPDHEYFGGELMMMGTPKTIYLNFGRGYTNEENTAVASAFGYYALAELSETRMVFAKSTMGTVGDYYEAYTFEAVGSRE